MKSHKNAAQGDLFGNTKIDGLKQEIHDLDTAIAKALKLNQYNQAKTLTEKQETLIKKLVELGDEN